MELELNAELVVLSACNTASPQQTGGETMSGLARAFLYAGARSLLVSHWSVDSIATADLSKRFFFNLTMKNAENNQALPSKCNEKYVGLPTRT